MQTRKRVGRERAEKVSSSVLGTCGGTYWSPMTTTCSRHPTMVMYRLPARTCGFWVANHVMHACTLSNASCRAPNSALLRFCPFSPWNCGCCRRRHRGSPCGGERRQSYSRRKCVRMPQCPRLLPSVCVCVCECVWNLVPPFCEIRGGENGPQWMLQRHASEMWGTKVGKPPSCVTARVYTSLDSL